MYRKFTCNHTVNIFPNERWQNVLVFNSIILHDFSQTVSEIFKMSFFPVSTSGVMHWSKNENELFEYENLLMSCHKISMILFCYIYI